MLLVFLKNEQTSFAPVHVSCTEWMGPSCVPGDLYTSIAVQQDLLV